MDSILGTSHGYGNWVLLPVLVLPNSNHWGLRGRQLVRPFQDYLPRNDVRSPVSILLDTADPASTATVGVSILTITAIPYCLEHGAGFPGLMVALIIVGLG
jgi:hypothetical protein